MWKVECSWEETSPAVFSDLGLTSWSKSTKVQTHFVSCFPTSVNFSLLLPIHPSPCPPLHCHTYCPFFTSCLFVFCPHPLPVGPPHPFFQLSTTPPSSPSISLCLVFPTASVSSLYFLLLHHPWCSSSAHCTNLPWQWIVLKIIPIAERPVLGRGSDR